MSMAEPTTERPTLVERAKGKAWDFLAHQGDVPGATLAEYLECAVVYACDETGHELTRADSPLTREAKS